MSYNILADQLVRALTIISLATHTVVTVNPMLRHLSN